MRDRRHSLNPKPFLKEKRPVVHHTDALLHEPGLLKRDAGILRNARAIHFPRAPNIQIVLT